MRHFPEVLSALQSDALTKALLKEGILLRRECHQSKLTLRHEEIRLALRGRNALRSSGRGKLSKLNSKVLLMENSLVEWEAKVGDRLGNLLPGCHPIYDHCHKLLGNLDALSVQSSANQRSLNAYIQSIGEARNTVCACYDRKTRNFSPAAFESLCAAEQTAMNLESAIHLFNDLLENHRKDCLISAFFSPLVKEIESVSTLNIHRKTADTLELSVPDAIANLNMLKEDCAERGLRDLFQKARERTGKMRSQLEFLIFQLKIHSWESYVLAGESGSE